ncbi:MAG TPA: hypothetical protein VG713_07400 [Pirellulales bacterium]|nr:hypothetical protein [Pirellulales bacterium]
MLLTAMGCHAHAQDAVSAPKLTANGPVGSYFMTRYWSGGTLEKAAWYFAPDGQVYQNLLEGLSPADLAAHRGPKGTFQFAGSTLTIRWADGKTSASDIERDQNPNVFMWDLGIFTPIVPVTDKQMLVGSYEGGESVSHDGNRVSNARTLEVRPDGSATWESQGFARGDNFAEGLSSSGAINGTWQWDGGWTMTLTGGGQTIRGLVFPFTTGDDPSKPDHLYFRGTMFKKR